jgi:hypothetical protein
MTTWEEFEAIMRHRQPTQSEIDAYLREQRLSIPGGWRVPLGAIVSFGVGLGLGTAQGSKMAGLRFRAEHAHKMPTTTTGWYLYHKSKNYNVAHGGIKEGFRMGARVSFWTTAMLGIEAMFDEYRKTCDLFNTVTAAVTVAGCFSIWSRSSHLRLAWLGSGLPNPSNVLTHCCRWLLFPHGRSHYENSTDCWTCLRRPTRRCRCSSGSTYQLCGIPEAPATVRLGSGRAVGSSR